MGDQDKPPLLDKLFEGDSYLKHYESDIILRWRRMAKIESDVKAGEGSLAKFAESYRQYGIVQKKSGIIEVSS